MDNLTEDDIRQIIEKQKSRPVTEFHAKTLELRAKKHWDTFYKRNETRFFKDRHWISREFEEILGNDSSGENEGASSSKCSTDSSPSPKYLLELGCGVGNLFFPLLKEIPHLKVLACDFSSKAIELVKKNEEYNEERVHAFIADLTETNCFQNQESLLSQKADFVSLVFVLSTIEPEKMDFVINNITSVTNSGGILYFRDYARYDMAQLRFKGGKIIKDNFYARVDGTRSYFFTPEEVESLFTKNGEWKKIQCEYTTRRTINVKEKIDIERKFLQAKFIRC